MSEVTPLEPLGNLNAFVAGIDNLKYPARIHMEFACEHCDNGVGAELQVTSPIFEMPNPRCLRHPQYSMRVVTFNVAEASQLIVPGV